MDIERVKSFAKTRMNGLKELARDLAPSSIANDSFILECKGKIEAYEELLGFILDFEDFERELEDNRNKAGE